MNKNEIFEYLDALRESGAINMFEGSKYLIDMFGLNRNEARNYLIEWMQTYNPTQPAPYMAVSNDRMSIDPYTGNVSIGTVTQRMELKNERAN